MESTLAVNHPKCRTAIYTEAGESVMVQPIQSSQADFSCELYCIIIAVVKSRSDFAMSPTNLSYPKTQKHLGKKDSAALVFLKRGLKSIHFSYNPPPPNL